MKKLVVAAVLAMAVAGCTQEQTNRGVVGGALGAGLGAATGALITRDAGGALAGAAIGGVGGAAIGAGTAPAQPQRTCTAYDQYGRAYQVAC
ncbi:bacteriocin [Pseudoxanthobacter sp.]|uniref:bacteriocin n=1 Tax=Pseudoxanthobacter sp. TaxID=1925742 RepID=UPI002FE36288